MPRSLSSVPRLSVKVGSQAFVDEHVRHIHWMHDQAPVCRAKVSIMKVVLVAGYEDCYSLLKDPRLVRDRRKAGGKSRFPFPMPKTVKVMAQSMINEDDPEHRRLRTLVHQAFTPRALTRLEERVETLTHELLDAMDKEGSGPIDLIPAYSLPIPVTVISEMLGVADEEMPAFVKGMRSLTGNYNLFSLLGTMFLDLPRLLRAVTAIIDRKRQNPGDDILTGLIQAEEAGERLTTDELVSMSFLLIFAGYETTVHLISNAVLTLLQHPEQLEQLKSDPALYEPAVEEILRYSGPVQGTKPNFPTETIVIRDVEIPKNSVVMPFLAAANRDPAIFDNPHTFDISRPRHKNMGFGHGPHFCLGAALARMETRIALRNLFDRFPNLRLAVPESELKRQAMPLWSRLRKLPLELRP